VTDRKRLSWYEDSFSPMARNIFLSTLNETVIGMVVRGIYSAGIICFGRIFDREFVCFVGVFSERIKPESLEIYLAFFMIAAIIVRCQNLASSLFRFFFRPRMQSMLVPEDPMKLLWMAQ
jgi:hypothetical protein